MIKTIKSSDLDNEKLSGCQSVKNDKLKKFDFFDTLVEKPWGYEYLAYKGDDVSVWILKIKKDAETSTHCHLQKKTALVLLSGQAVLSTLSNKFLLKEGDGILLGKKVFHSTKAVSEYIFLMEAETPSVKTDLVRLSDPYGRESKEYALIDELRSDLSKYSPVFFNELEEKEIENMRISIKRFEDNDSLRDNLKPSGTALLLSGEIFDQKNNKCYQAGDIFEVNISKEMLDIEIKNPVKILRILKNEKS